MFYAFVYISPASSLPEHLKNFGHYLITFYFLPSPSRSLLSSPPFLFIIFFSPFFLVFNSLFFYIPLTLSPLVQIVSSTLSHSDRGILIWDGIKKKEKDRESIDPAILYSQAALPIASEAIGLFRFLLSSTGWCDIVEQELLRPLVLMSQKLENNTVRNIWMTNSQFF